MVSNLTGPARVCILPVVYVIAALIAKQKDYEEDFLNSKPNQYEYVQRLQKWRDRYENFLKSRPRIQPLDTLSHYLTEFQYGRVDDIEVPGQYTEVTGKKQPRFIVAHLSNKSNRKRIATKISLGFRSLGRSMSIVIRTDNAGGASLSMATTIQKRLSRCSCLHGITVGKTKSLRCCVHSMGRT